MSKFAYVTYQETSLTYQEPSPLINKFFWLKKKGRIYSKTPMMTDINTMWDWATPPHPIFSEKKKRLVQGEKTLKNT